MVDVYPHMSGTADEDAAATVGQAEASGDSGHDIRRKYPNRVPVLVVRHKSCAHELDKCKYLVPINMKLMQFSWVLRRRMKLEQSEAMFLYSGSKVLGADATLMQIYNKHADDDGFLRCMYATENAFG